MNKKSLCILFTGLVLMAAGITAATCIGTKQIPLSVVWDSIFHYEEVLEKQLVRDVRIPRAIAAALTGGLLAAAGGAMQGVVRNPAAEPSIMGMTQGATLAVAAVNVYGAMNGIIGRTGAAFAGAVIGGILVLIFSMRNTKSMNMTRLLLAGTAVSTFFLSLASMIAIIGNRSYELAFWIAGGFQNIGWKEVAGLMVIGGLCLAVIFLFAQKINIVSLGEDTAIGLGVNPSKIRLIVIILLMPICGVCVAVAGNIAYVGLIIPHIIRKITGNDYKKILSLSFVWGGTLLVWADIAAKMVNTPYETPIGLFTALLGIPVFLILIRRERSV